MEDNLIFHLSHSVKITFSLYMAYELDLFRKISEKEKISLIDICQMTSLCERSAQALVSMCTSIGLFEVDDNQCFFLSDLSKSFLDHDSPYYIGHLLSIHLENKDVILSYEAFKQAILTGQPQVYQGKDLFQTHQAEHDKNIKFIKAMHAKSLASTEFWPEVVDFGQSSCFLDIGGGSGVHSMAAVRKWPQLKAIVLDRPTVCDIANEFIKKENLSLQISLVEGDMWRDPYPHADVHFLCDIIHDWPLKMIQLLIEKSYESLPDGGQVIIHELLFDNKKTGPLSVSMSNLSMLMWTEGQQLSKQELYDILRDTGFSEIEVTHTGFGDWCIVSGKKILSLDIER